MNQIKELFEYIFNAFKIWVIVQPWQAGIRVRNGKTIKRLSQGIYFKIPYFDSVYVQEERMRVVSLSIQTLTSKDLKTITLNGAVGYSISNIEKLYSTLYHPETTISNIAMSEIAAYIFSKDLETIKPEAIEVHVLNKLNAIDYGLKFDYFKITNYAIVRTFRIIQDQSWVANDLEIDKTK